MGRSTGDRHSSACCGTALAVSRDDGAGWLSFWSQAAGKASAPDTATFIVCTMHAAFDAISELRHHRVATRLAPSASSQPDDASTTRRVRPDHDFPRRLSRCPLRAWFDYGLVFSSSMRAAIMLGVPAITGNIVGHRLWRRLINPRLPATVVDAFLRGPFRVDRRPCIPQIFQSRARYSGSYATVMLPSPVRGIRADEVYC